MESKLPQTATDGTYVQVKFTKSTSLELNKFAKELGLDALSAEEMHATVVYSKKPLPVTYGESGADFTAYPKKLVYLGDKDSEWRALALEIDCKELVELHNSYKDIGYEHPYDDYIPHISLAYKPTEALDLDKINIPNFKIDIQKVITEKLKV